MFKVNDKVMVKQDHKDFEPMFVGRVGTVIAVLERLCLIKFDGFIDGHSGSLYYEPNGFPYDEENRSHWFVNHNNLVKVE